MRQYSHAYRRKNPTMFPEVCTACKPERRFKYPYDKAQHNQCLHGCIPPTGRRETYGLIAQSSNLFDHYSFVTPRETLLALSPMTKPRCPLYNLSTVGLDRFVKDEVEPDGPYNDSCKAVIHRLCEFMKNNFPSELRPSEIIKSGSLGKGTAVKGKSDADLVIFLSHPKYGSVTDIKNNMNTILRKMKKYLEYGECRIDGQTAHAIKVSVSCHEGHSHDVDILPSVNILHKGTSTIYSEMANNPRNREYYSAALAPLQLDFVSQQPTKLKTLIRLLKYWRKTAFEESTGYKRLPSSYPLELIAIGEWWDVDRPINFDLRKGFYNVLKALNNYRSLAHLWTINYRESDVNCDLQTRPYVMDPANPFNDVMTSCNCWEDVASNARECLRKPMFSDLNGEVGWM